MLACITYGSNDNRLSLYVANDTIRLWTDGGAGHLIDWNQPEASFLPYRDQWVHLAVQRQESTQIDLFINGELARSEPASGLITHSETVLINYTRASSQHQYSDDMWLQDVRLTAGKALYEPGIGFTPAPRLIGKLSGVVTDASGNPAERRVVSYVRDTGDRFAEVLSNAEGEFALPAYGGSESYAVALSPDPSENALIFDRVEPVQP